MDGLAPERSMSDVAEAFVARLSAAEGGDVGRALSIVARHLHALVDELRPTPDDLRRAIDFLTEVGHSSDARRQEWVLLADVLGVSTRVEDLAVDRPGGATPQTVPGPFYRADVPDLPDGASIARDGRGEPMTVTGRVTNLQGTGLRDVLIEVWQANGDGLYENQEPDLQPEFNLRGRFRSDAAGRFRFRTVRPRGYRLPEDGPVGRLLTGLGYRLERPAHMHFRLSAPGHRTLVTHVFDRDDPAIGRDALFGVKPELLAEFRRVSRAGEGPAWAVETSFILAPDAAPDTGRMATQQLDS